jgi:outer membrane protein assembly factor BamB
MPAGPLPPLEDLVFVGFNRRVVALDRFSGEIRWTWKTSSGSGAVAVLVDGDRLIACCQGYTWCLDPLTGREVWKQPLKGFGVGVACIASVRGSTTLLALSAAEEQAAKQKQAAVS